MTAQPSSPPAHGPTDGTPKGNVESTEEPEELVIRRPPAWWHRDLEPEQRRRVMKDLAIARTDRWVPRFAFMLTLSVIVAVMGLLLNSAAVVIGAMLLAPLMQPVLATGACLATALFRKSFQSLFKVVVATLWSIAVAYLIARIIPDGPLTPEVLARTQPDIKDLVVALAAGAAGSYATVRSDVSSSLPGVAVAVALVPPLASVGIALEGGAVDLAQGALLLYVTNLVAIIFASILIFIFTGFVAPRRLSDNWRQLATASLLAVGVVALVALPLYQASVQAIERNNQYRAVDQIVDDWLGDQGRLLEKTVSVDHERAQVKVEVRGFERPPDQGPLVEALTQSLPNYDVSVQWIRPLAATTTTLPPPEKTDQLLAEIDVVVDNWLANSTSKFQVDSISLDGSLVRIDAAGLGEPPDIAVLNTQLAAIDPTLVPGLNWVRLETFTATTLPSAEEALSDALERDIRAWADVRDLVVSEFEYDSTGAGGVRIEFIGATEPALGPLHRMLRQAAESDGLELDVFFIERQRVTTTTSPTPSTQ